MSELGGLPAGLIAPNPLQPTRELRGEGGGVLDEGARGVKNPNDNLLGLAGLAPEATSAKTKADIDRALALNQAVKNGQPLTTSQQEQLRTTHYKEVTQTTSYQEEAALRAQRKREEEEMRRRGQG